MSQSTSAPMRPTTTQASPSSPTRPVSVEELPDLATYLTTYARQRPDVAAMWCFGVGFVLGWKLKPW